ncbi:ATP-binding protein [Phaeobacter sp.]|uniref:ATP-binding protein n=1 Tax=Phaeobacter sp. TaxID=1902409 RepID=UPI0025DA8770|nr:ATP-binding protein [Phaeobacter sp.]
MMTISSSLRRVVAAQNELVKEDLPSRFASISIVSLVSLYYLTLGQIAVVYGVYILVELVGLHVYRRLRQQVTMNSVILFVVSAFVGVWTFNTIPLLLYLHEDGFSKVMGAMLLVIALNHCVVARSHWMFFGLLTALPIISVLIFLVGSTIWQIGSLTELIIAAIILLIGAAYTLFGIWTQHRMANNLRDALADAQAASEAKSRFLASMSHEIRTPLNAICGMSELIAEGKSDPDANREHGRLLFSSATALTGILDDILDHAKIESGQVELVCSTANLRAELTSAVDMFRFSAHDKSLDLGLVIADSVPDFANCDILRLRQILSNLVSNAVKYTETGRIDVDIFAEPSGRKTRLIVQVKDTGRGLSAEDLTQLFSDFFRAENSNAPSVPGTGLGLSIARRLARKMGGDLVVESELGKGSTFTLTCDIWAAEMVATPAVAATTQSAESDDLGVKSLLVVDDTASNRRVVRAFLQRFDVELLEAENGREALDILATKQVDLILLDMRMPVMDGKEMLIELAKAPPETAQTPVVMLTANAATEDRETYLALGASGYIAKPVRKNVLLQEINRVAAAAAPRVPS